MGTTSEDLSGGTGIGQKATPYLAALLVASTLFLCWHLSQTVGPALAPEPREEAHITIRPVKDPDRASEVRLFAVLDDGVYLPWSAVRTTGVWTTAQLASNTQPYLVGEASPAASVAFVARRPQLLFLRTPESGGVRIEAGGKTRLVDLRSTREGLYLLAVDAPGPPASTLLGPILLAALLAILLAGILAWRPWRNSKSSLLWLALYTGLLHAGIWVSFPVGLNNDSGGYLDALAHQLSGSPQYFPPGYGLLMLAARALPLSGMGLQITALQHLLMVATVLWLHRLARALLPAEWAYAAALFVATFTPLLYLPQALLSESFGLFCLTGCLALLLSVRTSASLPAALAAGLLGGLSTLTRVSPLGAILAAACLLLPPSKRNLPPLLAAGGGLVLVLLLPAAWFGWKSGRFALADSTGLHLYQKVFFEGGFVSPEGEKTRTMLALMDGAHPKDHPHWEMRAMLSRLGVGYTEAESLALGAALEGIRDHFFAYLIQSVLQAKSQIFLDPSPEIPWWGQQEGPRRPELENPPLGRVSAASLSTRILTERIFATLWPLLVWLSLAGCLIAPFLKQRAEALALALIVPVYILSQALIEVLCPRYTVMAVPFTVLMACLPLALLGSAVAASVRGFWPAQKPLAPPGRSGSILG